MTNYSLRGLLNNVLALFALVSVTFTALSSAQTNPSSNQTTATTTANSRAEKEAEQLVSLSAERIIALLENEPGLMLEVKKMLVRTAYDQGRLLDAQDLTDEALERLIWKDETIRALITREIEDREYVRVKPTREERRREQQAMSARQNRTRLGEAEAEQAGIAAGQSQEDAYWSRRQRELISPQFPANGGTSPTQQAPTPAPPPSQNPSMDQRRALERAQAQFSEGDSSSGLPLNVLGMQGMSPDQLASLSSAHGGGGSFMGSGPQLEETDAVGTDATGTSGSLTPGFGSGLSAGLAAGTLGLESIPNPSYATSEDAASSEAATPDVSSSRQSTSPRRNNGLANREPLLLRHRPNPYADVPSLYDLYSQYSERTQKLERFGEEVFRNGTGNFDQLPMDVPAGPDYVLGPGDGVSIDLWGSVSQRLRRVVDREGRLPLPEVGAIQVAGRSLADVQHLVQVVLRSQFRDVQADVSLARLRTVRVYVVGDVEHPGAYEVSSLSTSLNALYEAGGPTSQGSLRTLKHYRGKQLIEDVDVYDLLLHGVRAGTQRLESGDTILVPPLGNEITTTGMVRRPAVYELKNETNLAEVLELAGGVLPSGTLRHIDVERVQAHESRSMLALDIPENNDQQAITQALENFKIEPGDKIKISPIVAFADNSVFLDGHVFRPGKYAYRDGMKVTDLIKSYKDLLPEPYGQHAEIIRLKAPDYKPEILAFNLENVFSGKDEVVLRPLDTIRVFGRYDFEDPPVITVTGAVRDPGDHVTNGSTHLRDAIFLAGNTTPDAQLDDVQVFRRSEDGKLTVLSVNLKKALSGDSAADVPLQSKDRVIVHKNLTRSDPPVVSVEGEVPRPGKYALGENLTAAGLVRLAGGLKRSAYREEADLTRYTIENGQKTIGDHETVQIAKALAGEPDTDFRLHDGDVLTIRQQAGWNDRSATITIKGEVVHPGTYGIEEGERLSSALERAGGLRADAYPYGAIFERAQVRDLEEKNRSQLIRQVQNEESGVTAVDDPFMKQSAVLQWKNALEKLQNTPPTGRMIVHISGNLKRWANTSGDIPLRNGDVLFVPKKPTFVMVDGAVYNPTAVTFKHGKSAGWYLTQAGGPTPIANKKAIFVVRADGTVVGGKSGLFAGGAVSAEIQPGDMVVVPDKAFGGGLNWKNTLQVAQLVSAVGIAVQVARGF